MRALSNLITVNDPDLVLFVGEALVRFGLEHHNNFAIPPGLGYELLVNMIVNASPL